MARQRKISARADHGQLQSEILAIVMRRCDCTVREVFEEFTERRPIAYTTVLTVMTRLVERGVLRRKSRGNVGVFSPATSTDSSAAAMLVDQLIGRFGAIGVSEFVERARSRPELLDQLRELVDDETGP